MTTLGVVDGVYLARGDDPTRAAAAAADGFAHIDPLLGTDPASLALPIGCPTAFPKPVDTWCATPAPAAGPGMWERAVRWWRAAPRALLEPWAGAVVGSTEAVAAFRAEVPGLRLLVDTGHVADWGGDPCELLHLADHVQLRQGAPGTTQLHPDDSVGVVDFAAVAARLDRIGYAGKVSVEYFDLPTAGWPCPDPEGWVRDLRARLAGLRSGW
ncbi:MAG: sugar phosphate isomerase/epimerase family protein [Actinomycetota bacterium]